MRTTLGVLATALLTGTFGLALGAPVATDPASEANVSETTAIEDVEESESGEEVETATMSIPVEEGDVIDLRTPTDVKIETWDGDEVLLIVEKIKRSSPRPAVDPVIRITRRGNAVRIETTGPVWQQYGNDVSFRLVLPDEHMLDAIPPAGPVSDVGALSRWTIRVWRVVHREALRRLL